MPPTYKVVLLGEGRVGKTSLVNCFISGAFDSKQASTVQANMYSKKEVLVSEACIPGNQTASLADDPPTLPVNLSIWDTAGQERFHALGPIYYRNAHGALLVYDVTDSDTLEKVRSWIVELRAVVGDSIRLVICGNKCDAEKERDVSEEEGKRFASAQGALHFSTSAKTGHNVVEAFAALAAVIARDEGVLKPKGKGKGSSGGGTGGGLFPPGSAGGGNGRRKRRGVRIAEDVDDEEDGQKQGGEDAASAANVLSTSDYVYDDLAGQSERTQDAAANRPEKGPSGQQQAKPITLGPRNGQRTKPGNQEAKKPSSGCCA